MSKKPFLDIFPGFRLEGSDLVAVRYLGVHNTTPSQRGVAWEMVCVRQRENGQACGATRVVLVKRIGRTLACVRCCEEKRQQGRSKGGTMATQVPKPPRERPALSAGDVRSLVIQFQKEADDGHPRRQEIFLEALGPREATMANLREAVELVLLAPSEGRCCQLCAEGRLSGNGRPPWELMKGEKV